MGRVDFLQSRKHNLFGHFYRDAYDRKTTHAVTSSGSQAQTAVDTTNYSVTSTYTFSPTLLNEATFDYMHTTSSTVPDQYYPPESLGHQGSRRTSTAKASR